MDIKWIGFDADDTLWRNEELYREGRNHFLDIVSGYPEVGAVEGDIEEIEVENLPYYGYGVMSFVLSLIETAIHVTGGAIRSEDIQRLIKVGKEMLSTPPSLYPGVGDVLDRLSQQYPLLLITKGDLFHQQRKVEQSGLRGYFQHVEVVSQKTPEVYAALLNRHQIRPVQFIMIGNSLRSDIQPVIEVGGRAVHVSDHPSWSFEDGDLSEEEQTRVMEIGRIDQVSDLLLHDLKD